MQYIATIRAVRILAFMVILPVEVKTGQLKRLLSKSVNNKQFYLIKRSKT